MMISASSIALPSLPLHLVEGVLAVRARTGPAIRVSAHHGQVSQGRSFEGQTQRCADQTGPDYGNLCHEHIVQFES